MEYNIRNLANLKHLFKLSGELWQRNLLVLSISQIIMMFGMSSCVPFLPLFIRDLGISDPELAHLWSGYVFAGPFMLSLLTVPIWGYLGDKYGRKLMIVRAIIGLALVIFLMSFVQTVEQLLILRIIQGAVSGFIASVLSFTSANTPQERSGYAIGILYSSLAAGNIFGPLFGGIIADISGIRSTFMIVAGLCLISGLLVIVLVKENNIVVEDRKNKSFIGLLRFLKSKPILSLFFILIILSQAGIFFTSPIFPFFIENLGAPEEYLSTITGVLIGIVGIFSIIFAPKWGRRNDNKDYHKTLKIASTICGIALIAHIFATHYMYLIPLRIVFGIFLSAIIPTLYAVLNKHTPDNIKGAIMGFASSATIAGNLIGYLSSGWIAATMGLDTCFVVSGSLLLIVALLVTFDKYIIKTELWENK